MTNDEIYQRAKIYSAQDNNTLATLGKVLLYYTYVEAARQIQIELIDRAGEIYRNEILQVINLFKKTNPEITNNIDVELSVKNFKKQLQNS